MEEHFAKIVILKQKITEGVKLLKLEWHNEKRKISDLIPYESNPRNLTEKQYKDLKKSLTKFNLAEIPAINLDNKICAGHQRLKIMSEVYGSDFEIDVRVPNRKLSEKEFQEYNVRSNKNTGEWQFDILANEFEIDELIEWGFDEKELDLNLWNDTDESKLDEVPEVPKVAVSKLGDLFLLDGKHRVLCGDSTKAEDVEKLIENNKIDFVFSDPPYGIEAVKGNNKTGCGGVTKFGKVGGENIVESKTYSKIIGDDTTETAFKHFSLCEELGFKNICLWGGNYFTSFLKPSRCWFVWDKEMTGNFSEAEMGWTTFEKGGVRIFKHLWNGLSRAGNRAEELKGRVHPTQKPVGLFKQILQRFDYLINIFDGFLGSGSTLIACEQTKRICYGMELDPLYIDVILKRYKKLYPEAKFECLNRKYDFNKLFTE